MSFTQKDLLKDILERVENNKQEVKELKRLNDRFQESEKAKTAKEVAFSDRLSALRKEFSRYFVQPKTEVRV